VQVGCMLLEHSAEKGCAVSALLAHACGADVVDAAGFYPFARADATDPLAIAALDVAGASVAAVLEAVAAVGPGAAGAAPAAASAAAFERASQHTTFDLLGLLQTAQM